MQVILDSNEHAHKAHFKAQLEQTLGLTVQIAPLGESSGDLLVQLDNGDVCVFERKDAPSDICASIADGRLFAQAEQIPLVARFPFLVLHGALKYSERGFVLDARNGKWGETGWRKSSIQHALIRAQALGMLLIETETYVQEVVSLIKWCSSADNTPTIRKRILKNTWETPAEQIRRRKIEFISQIEGVGTERASNLVDAYPERSLYELLTLAAIPTDLKIPLWGQGTFETVQKFLGLQPALEMELVK